MSRRFTLMGVIALGVLYIGILGNAWASQPKAVTTAEPAPAANFTPYFVVIKPGEANLRRGPSVRYPVKTVYHLKGYPLEVIGEFDHWLKVRDRDNESGWLHENLLSRRRAAMTLKPMYLFYRPQGDAPVTARLEPHVVTNIVSCHDDWCHVKGDGYDGWIVRQYLWGVYAHENFQ
ncbi:MAG: SH3 domain-containing protein [Alphaproteobacteria bacterium]|nr:SH3 domain-containing protein [Alphaproteobacteria bacterium]